MYALRVQCHYVSDTLIIISPFLAWTNFPSKGKTWSVLRQFCAFLLLYWNAFITLMVSCICFWHLSNEQVVIIWSCIFYFLFFYTDKIWWLKGKRLILHHVFAVVSSALFFQVQRDLSCLSNKRISHLWWKITCSITTKRDHGLIQHTKPFYAQGLFYMKIVTWDFHPFYTDNGTKLSYCGEGGGELHTPSSTRGLSGTNTRGSLSFFILIQDVFSDYLIQMYLLSIKICRQCFVPLSAWCLHDHSYISCSATFPVCQQR